MLEWKILRGTSHLWTHRLHVLLLVAGAAGSVTGGARANVVDCDALSGAMIASWYEGDRASARSTADPFSSELARCGRAGGAGRGASIL